MKQMFEMLAAYNAWVNDRLYDAVAQLPDPDRRADHGAFFGSLHGTLNHLLRGDRIWMHRFTGEGEEPMTLDDILYDDFGELRDARRAEDARIIAYIGGLSEATLKATVHYRTTRNPTEIEQFLGPLLIHFFNHQTHHRGQAHCLLTKLTGRAPSFDLLVYQRQTGVSLVKGAGGAFAQPERRV
jgi:uncharacterized damage-inducible protein DinB